MLRTFIFGGMRMSIWLNLAMIAYIVIAVALIAFGFRLSEGKKKRAAEQGSQYDDSSEFSTIVVTGIIWPLLLVAGLAFLLFILIKSIFVGHAK